MACGARLVAEHGNVRAEVKNISYGGVCITSEARFAATERVMLLLDLMPSKRISAWGTVVYSQAVEAGLYRTGVRFHEIGPQSRALITELMIQQLVTQAL